jgi:hypothetical protein
LTGQGRIPILPDGLSVESTAQEFPSVPIGEGEDRVREQGPEDGVEALGFGELGPDPDGRFVGEDPRVQRHPGREDV